jgi:hypothetical protein
MVGVVTITATPEKGRWGLPNGACTDNMDTIIADNCGQTLHWRKDKVNLVRGDARRALQELQRERSAVADLHATLEATEELANEADQQRIRSERASHMLRASAEASAKRAAAFAEVSERLLREKETRLADVREAEARLEEESSRAEARAVEIENSFKVYKDALGLSITRAAPSVVEVSFTLLDEMQPERECSFLLGLTDPKTYTVTDCSPTLPPALLNKLVDRLNQEPTAPTALPAFCVGMRKAFKLAISRRGVVGGS